MDKQVKNQFNDFCGIRETCEHLKAEGMSVPESTLRRWVKEGHIPAMQSGRRIFLYYPNVVDALKRGVSFQPQQPDRTVRGIRRIV